MTGPSGSQGTDDLNFDRAEAGSGTGSTAPSQCANCGKPVGATYHTVNGTTICSACRAQLENVAAPVRSPAILVKAITFGFGASVVGAIIYYVVMRYLNLEIGLVAILTGWMVGKAMSKATAGRGGRLMQVSAALLTYVSVAMAYFPFAVQQTAIEADNVAATVFADSAGADANPARSDAERQSRGGEGDAPGTVLGLVLVAAFALVLPILVIVGSMPGGLISAAIIGFGMMQAWQLTGAPKLVFEGPFRLAPKAAAGDGGGAPS